MTPTKVLVTFIFIYLFVDGTVCGILVPDQEMNECSVQTGVCHWARKSPLVPVDPQQSPRTGETVSPLL